MTVAAAPALDRTGYRRVVRQLAVRNLVGIVRLPSTFIPSLVMPVVFVIAFSGAFAGTRPLLGLADDQHIMNWYAPMAVLQGAMFAGLSMAFSSARDLENGFFDRLLVAPASRAVLLLGALAAAALRALMSLVVVMLVGLAGGMRFEDGVWSMLTITVAAVGIAMIGGLWGLGVVYRLKSQSAGLLAQTLLFFALFLSTAQVPMPALTGWLHAVARVNPMTNLFTLARAGFLDPVTWAEVWPGLLALGGGLALFSVFAARGLARIIP